MQPRPRAVAAIAVRRSPSYLLVTFLVLASLFASFARYQFASAQTVTNTLADAVPADTPMFIQADLSQDSEQWKLFYQLLDRSGLSTLMEQEGGKVSDISDGIKSAHMSGPVAIAFTDADALMSGSAMTDGMTALSQTTMATATAGNPPRIPAGMVVLMRSTNDAEGQYSFVKQIVANEAKNSGATVKSSDYNGVTIEYWESTDPEQMPTAVANVNGTVVLSVTPKDIEPVIDTLAGKTEPLSKNADFTKISSAFTTDSMVFSFANGQVLMNAYAKANPEAAKSLGGSANAGSFSGANVYVSDNGFHLDSASYYVEGTGKSSATPVVPSAGTPSMAAKVPANALLFTNGFDFNKSGATEMLGALLQLSFGMQQSEMGPGATPVPAMTATPTVDDAYAMIAKQVGFNPKTELLDKLGGEWMYFADASDLNSAETISAAFVSGTTDEKTVTQTTQKVTDLVNAQLGADAELSTRDLNGSTINVITTKNDSGQTMKIEYGVVGGQLVIGVNDGLDNYLNGTSEKLADNANFKQTFDALPKDNLTSETYVNLDRLIPMFIQYAQSTETSSSTSAKDADPSCKAYADQAAAQAAYDKDPSNNWALDMDFDGKACEDFWGTVAATPASPVASPIAGNPVNIPAMGAVTYTDGDMMRSSAIILVGK